MELPSAAAWMDLEIIILSEVWITQRQTMSYDITYMWHLKNNTDESIYKTETNSTHKHRKQTYVYQRRERGREG